ncbi:MAG TPA: hypothetical protein VKA08_06590, partial [Balneolales bacterium]|nr:hypothetical protein [Balneolales bacterium]
SGQLQFSLAAAGGLVYNYLPFRNKVCGKVSTDVAITNTAFTGTGDKSFRTRLQNCGYHSTTAGEAPGVRTGDVDSAIVLNGTQAYFQVYRCLNDDCNTPDSVEYLTSGGSTGVQLGTVPLFSTATLLIDWNTLSPNQFTFQLNNDLPIKFDPVAAGAPINADVPNVPEKYLGAQLVLSDPNDIAEMTAVFDNVTDGLLSDDFNSGKYLDGSFWMKTDGRRQVENGRLLLETGQEYVGDSSADNRFNYTSLISNDEMIPNTEVVEADITLDPATFVIGLGGNHTEVYALLEMEFRPPGAGQNDYTDSFVIRAALREGSPGVGGTAEISAIGCADYSCTSKHSIANDNQTFNTSVVKGQSYHMKIARQGNEVIDITMDNQEILTVDLSDITEFASTEFYDLALRTASRGTDTPGEEAFVRAFFDNVQAGTP